jgi:hypothetical protein
MVATSFHKSGGGVGGEPVEEQCSGAAGDTRQWLSAARKDAMGIHRLGWAKSWSVPDTLDGPTRENK